MLIERSIVQAGPPNVYKQDLETWRTGNSRKPWPVAPCKLVDG